MAPRGKSERRTSARFSSQQPVSLKFKGAEESAITRDISRSGVFLFTDTKLPVGSDLELVLTLPSEVTLDSNTWVCCTATVVRVDEPAAGGKFGIAARMKSCEVLPEVSQPKHPSVRKGPK